MAYLCIVERQGGLLHVAAFLVTILCHFGNKKLVT
nr:MAG TPA: hypothetical protein [Caudoviricetes sp.]